MFSFWTRCGNLAQFRHTKHLSVGWFSQPFSQPFSHIIPPHMGFRAFNTDGFHSSKTFSLGLCSSRFEDHQPHKKVRTKHRKKRVGDESTLLVPGSFFTLIAIGAPVRLVSLTCLVKRDWTRECILIFPALASNAIPLRGRLPRRGESSKHLSG